MCVVHVPAHAPAHRPRSEREAEARKHRQGKRTLLLAFAIFTLSRSAPQFVRGVHRAQAHERLAGALLALPLISVRPPSHLCARARSLLRTHSLSRSRCPA
eukprot:1847527-Pleurochrysis_carterae.AAC.1